MKVNVHAVNFNVDKKLVSFIEERLTKLEKFYDKVVASDVFLKVENTSDKENKIVYFKRFISLIEAIKDYNEKSKFYHGEYAVLIDLPDKDIVLSGKSEKYKCECGSGITLDYKIKHLKTLKHQEYLKSLSR